MWELLKQKKGIIEDILPIIYLILIFTAVFVMLDLANSKEKQDTTNKVKVSVARIVIQNELASFIRKEAILDGKPATISDIIAMLNKEEVREENSRQFKLIAKRQFESKFPLDYSKFGDVDPWWLVTFDYSKLGEVNPRWQSIYEEGGYTLRVEFDYSHTPMSIAEGGGAECYRNLEDLAIVESVTIPKINGGNAKLVFCISKSYIEVTT